MSVLFLVPLAISAIAAYIYFHWADEGAHILGLAAALGLIAAIIMAPWELQAILLTLGLLVASYLLRQRQSSVSSTPHAPEVGGAATAPTVVPTSAAASVAPTTTALPTSPTAPASTVTEAASFTYRGIPYVEHGAKHGVACGASEGASDGASHGASDGASHGASHAAAHEPIAASQRQGIYRGVTWHTPPSHPDVDPTAVGQNTPPTVEIRYRGLPVRRKS